MEMSNLVIDITDGLTEYCNRVGLKSVMSRFGEVDVCWIPPVWDRKREAAYVKFKSPDAAEGALVAMSQLAVQMHGVPLQGRYRVGGDVKGSGRGGGDGGGAVYTEGPRPAVSGYTRRSRSRHRRKSRHRSRSKYRSRSRRDRRRGRSHSRHRSRSQKRRRSESRSDISKEKPINNSLPGMPSLGGRSAAALLRISVNKLLPSGSLGLRLDGTMVHGFEEEGAAAYGWKIGDQVVDINGATVSNKESLVEEFRKAKEKIADRPIVFGVIRSNSGSYKHDAMEGAEAARALLGHD